ncbi:MAG: GPW/gp25 family protein [Nitriliruptorales bacterium]|nr:GPW/gp25 family protein [Nitriliruptorales bacterium]
MVADGDFVGRGLAYPLQTDSTGRLALVAGRDELDEAIRIILATAPGERPMRPEFGCRIHDYVYEPISGATSGTLTFAVERAIGMWEPRVDVESVEVFGDDEHEGVLYLDIVYRVKDTNDERNLVFPFYTIPQGEEER